MTVFVKLYDFGQLSMIYERRRTSTRLEIADATIAELLELGYQHLTVTAIAERADIGRGTFYRYFESIEAVIVFIFETHSRRLDEAMHDLMLQYESPEREQETWRATFHYLEDLKPLFQRVDGQGSEIIWQQFENYIMERFRQSLESGLIMYSGWMQLPTDVMAYFTGGAVLSVMRHWFSGALNYDSDTMGNMVYQMLYHQPSKNS